MSIIFGALIGEMGVLIVLLLPLPFVVRSNIVHVLEAVQKSQNFKVGAVFLVLLLGLQFMDCLNRLKRLHGLDSPYYTTNAGSLSYDQLATKFYSQRNLYLTGFVLYLILAIFTVTTIVKKLVKKEGEFRKLVAEHANKDNTSEVRELEQAIEKKERDLEVLKKQIAGLQRSYDELTPSEVRGKDD